ncbi:MAG: DUF2795 domain-containing protein [Halobacteriales archaeon]|nr:DUF2795 domain-containing protein [Halobacteriales archaeon]
MRIPEIRDHVVREIEFPASCDEVKDKIGDICLESPLGSEEKLGDVLGRCGAREFESADELYDVVVGNVSGEHIGRKKYDDRGPSLGQDEVSF